MCNDFMVNNQGIFLKCSRAVSEWHKTTVLQKEPWSLGGAVAAGGAQLCLTRLKPTRPWTCQVRATESLGWRVCSTRCELLHHQCRSPATPWKVGRARAESPVQSRWRAEPGPQPIPEDVCSPALQTLRGQAQLQGRCLLPVALAPGAGLPCSPALAAREADRSCPPAPLSHTRALGEPRRVLPCLTSGRSKVSVPWCPRFIFDFDQRQCWKQGRSGRKGTKASKGRRPLRDALEATQGALGSLLAFLHSNLIREKTYSPWAEATKTPICQQCQANHRGPWEQWHPMCPSLVRWQLMATQGAKFTGSIPAQKPA